MKKNARRGGKFGKISIIAGGPSSEREISIASGRAVFRALKHINCKVSFIDVKKSPEKEISGSRTDIAFIALHGGFGEDGTIQRILEGLNIPYTGSGPMASSLAFNKIASKEIFLKNKIAVPDYTVADKKKSLRAILKEIELPLVVKPEREGSSIGLSIVNEKSKLKDALGLAFRYSSNVLIEKYITGRELTVGILADEALPVIEIVPKKRFYDFNAKYKDKGTSYVVPAFINSKITKKAGEMALRAHRALGCRDFSRVDMRLSEDGKIFILEVNTIPGLTERSLLPKAAGSAGIGFIELCIRLLEMAAARKH